MKWVTHQAMAVMGSFALGLPLTGMAAAWAGSVLPDILDQREAGKALFFRQRKFNKVHRRASHWFGWWLILWLFPLHELMGPLPAALINGFGFGAFTHCLLDMCTTHGTPLVPFAEKRFSLKICSTGGIGEYAILIATIVVFWLAKRQAIAEWNVPLF